MDRYQRNRLFSSSTLCVASFLRDRSKFRHHSLSVLLPKFGNDVEHRTSVEIDSLLHTLQVEIASYTLNDHYRKETKENITVAMVVIVVEDSADLARLNCSLLRLCISDCEFVITLGRIFENEASFLQEADVLQRSIWSKEFVMKLTILGRTRETVLLAASRSFEPNEICTPSSPVLLGSCRIGPPNVRGSNVWRFDGETIVGEEISMNGCIIVVAYYDRPPYSFVRNETTGDRLSGLEGFMIEEVLYSMDARLIGEAISPVFSNDSDADDLRVIADQLGESNTVIDFLIGGLLWNPDEGTDYTMPYDVVPIVWVIPVKANVSLRGLVAPFSTYVWIALVCVILLGVLIKFFLIKDISLLDVLGLLLSVAVFRQPERASSRILFISWTFFGFFMSLYYLASLADQLVNASNLQIETMKELFVSGLDLGGTSRYAELFNEVDETDDDVEEDIIIRSIRERFRVFPYEDYVQRLSDLLNGKDQSMALVVKLNASNSRLNLPKEYVHALNENMGNHPLAIATWKGFPCLREINIKMQGLIETGITDYWTRLITMNGSYFRSQDETTSDNDVDLESVAPGFLLLIIGYLLGFCVLVIEIIVYPSRLSKRKVNVIKK